MQLSSTHKEQLTFFTKTFLFKVIRDELSSPYLIDDLLLKKSDDKDIVKRKTLAIDFIMSLIEKETLNKDEHTIYTPN